VRVKSKEKWRGCMGWGGEKGGGRCLASEESREKGWRLSMKTKRD